MIRYIIETIIKGIILISLSVGLIILLIGFPIFITFTTVNDISYYIMLGLYLILMIIIIFMIAVKMEYTLFKIKNIFSYKSYVKRHKYKSGNGFK